MASTEGSEGAIKVGPLMLSAGGRAGDPGPGAHKAASEGREIVYSNDGT